MRSRRMNVLREIRNDVNGSKVLLDWIGEGVPASQEHANSRACVCLHGNEGVECPYHKAARWWERFFKDPIATAIRKQIELKSRMKLETPYDKDLKMCSVCGCCISTKVWVPTEHIKAHTPTAVMKKFPPWCWQLKETS